MLRLELRLANCVELRNTKKGDKSVSDFFARIKKITDALLSIGETVSHQEQLDVILDGLPTEFESIVTLISTKSEWFEFDEIESLLLAHETRVTKQTEVLNVVASVNITQAAPKAPASTEQISQSTRVSTTGQCYFC